MQAEYILCCDWGTTGFRLRLTNLKAEVIAETHAENGILSHYNSWQSRNDENPEHRFDFYLQYIQSQMGEIRHSLEIDIAKLPLVISGMAISSIGMMNLPYESLPFSLEIEYFYFMVGQLAIYCFFGKNILRANELMSEEEIEQILSPIKNTNYYWCIKQSIIKEGAKRELIFME